MRRIQLGGIGQCLCAADQLLHTRKVICHILAEHLRSLLDYEECCKHWRASVAHDYRHLQPAIPLFN